MIYLLKMVIYLLKMVMYDDLPIKNGDLQWSTY